MTNNIPFLEKDLETIIFETENTLICDRGMFIRGEKKRQLRLGGYGVADIVTFRRVRNNPPDFFNYKSHIEITVYELKQKTINSTTLMQAYRYCKGIQSYIKQTRGFSFPIKFQVVLVGKELCNGDFCYVPDFIPNLTVYTYSYDFDGISFNQEANYKLTNEGF